MSQVALSRETGIAQGTLSRLETGTYKDIPGPEIVRPLSISLGIPERTLLEAIGYAMLEDGPSFDPDLFVMMNTVQTWTARQRELLWRFIEVVEEAT